MVEVPNEEWEVVVEILKQNTDNLEKVANSLEQLILIVTELAQKV